MRTNVDQTTDSCCFGSLKNRPEIPFRTQLLDDQPATYVFFRVNTFMKSLPVESS